MSDSSGVFTNPALASFAEALDAAAKVNTVSQQVENLISQNARFAKELDNIKRAINQVAGNCSRTTLEQREYTKNAELELRHKLDQQTLFMADQSNRIKAFQNELLQQQQVIAQQSTELAHLKNNWTRLTFALDQQFENNVRYQAEELRKTKQGIVLPLVTLFQQMTPSGMLPSELGQSTTNLLLSTVASTQPEVSSAPPNHHNPIRDNAMLLNSPGYLQQSHSSAGPSRAIEAHDTTANSSVLVNHTRSHSRQLHADAQQQRVLSPALDQTMIPHGLPAVSSPSPSGSVDNRTQPQSMMSSANPPEAISLTNGVSMQEGDDSDDSIEFVSSRQPSRRVRPAYGIVKVEPGAIPELTADASVEAQVETTTAPPLAEAQPEAPAPSTQAPLQETPMQMSETSQGSALVQGAPTRNSPPRRSTRAIAAQQANTSRDLETPMQVSVAAQPETAMPSASSSLPTDAQAPSQTQNDAETEMEVDVPLARDAARAANTVQPTVLSNPQPAPQEASPAAEVRPLPPAATRRLSEELFTPRPSPPRTDVPRGPATAHENRAPPSAADSIATDDSVTPYTVYAYYGDPDVKVTPSMISDDPRLLKSYISRSFADILLHRQYAREVSEPDALHSVIAVDLYLRCDEMVETRTGTPRPQVRSHTRLPNVHFEVVNELPRGAILGRSLFIDKNLSIKASVKKEWQRILVQNGTGQGSFLFQFPESELQRNFSSRFTRACALADYAVQRYLSRFTSSTGAVTLPKRTSIASADDLRRGKTVDIPHADHPGSDLLTRLDYQSERTRERGPPLEVRIYEDRQHRYDRSTDDLRGASTYRPANDRQSSSTMASRLRSPTRQQRYEGRADRDYDNHYSTRHSRDEVVAPDSPLTDQSSDFIVEEPDEGDSDSEGPVRVPLAQRLLPEREQRRVSHQKRLAAARRRVDSGDTSDESSAEEPLSLRTRGRPSS